MYMPFFTSTVHSSLYKEQSNLTQPFYETILNFLNVNWRILLFTASDLASITSHIHSWVFFLLWLHPFILSGVISPLISSSILGTYWPGEFLFQYPIIFLFILFMGFSRQEYWSGLPFPSPVAHVLSELSTMTHPSWAALHGTADSFIELSKLWPMWLDHSLPWTWGIYLLTSATPDLWRGVSPLSCSLLQCYRATARCWCCVVEIKLKVLG